MTIEFMNLNQEEKDMLLKLEESAPEEIVLLDIVASFDGFNGMKLISDLGPAVIAGVSTIIAAILSRKKNAPSPQLPPPAPQLPPPVIIVVIGGERKEIQDVAEIKIAGDAQ